MQNKRERHVLADSTVFEAAKNPAALQKGFSREIFDVNAVHPTIYFGSNVAIRCSTFIRIRGQSILSVAPPEISGGPFRLNAHFMDRNGNTTLRIVNNEWQAGVENWDVETVQNRITIRQGLRKIVLVLRTEPPDGFHIERLKMATHGYEITCDGDEVVAKSPTGKLNVFAGGRHVDTHAAIIIG